MTKVAVVASASGNGKTTLGRELAQRLGTPFFELDVLVHGAGWVETPDDELRALVELIVSSDRWVIDGPTGAARRSCSRRSRCRGLARPAYSRPAPTAWRTWLRLRRRELLWNGNRESLGSVLWGRESLVVWSFRSHFRRRREWAQAFSHLRVIR